MTNVSDEPFDVPVKHQSKFNGKDYFCYKNVTPEQRKDTENESFFRYNIAYRVARHIIKKYQIQVFTFKPASDQHECGLYLWTNTTEGGLRPLYDAERLARTIAELNLIFGGPNLEGSTRAMWWCEKEEEQ